MRGNNLIEYTICSSIDKSKYNMESGTPQYSHRSKTLETATRIVRGGERGRLAKYVDANNSGVPPTPWPMASPAQNGNAKRYDQLRLNGRYTASVLSNPGLPVFPGPCLSHFPWAPGMHQLHSLGPDPLSGLRSSVTSYSWRSGVDPEGGGGSTRITTATPRFCR